jgi:tetratricopeptide (TPR) repeat protein
MVEMRKAAGFAAVLAVCLASTGAMADVLYMNDGQKQTGIIIKPKTDNSRVTIRTTSGEISIPRSKVSRIEEMSPAASYGQLGDQYLQTGNFEKAIESYQAGLGYEAGNLDLKQKLQQAKGGVSSQSAETQATLDDRARRTVDQAMKLAQTGNFDTAYNTMKSVEPSELSPVYPEYRKNLAELYLLWGQSMLDKQNTGGAAQKLNEVLKLDPDNARAKALLVKTFEGDPTKLEESAKYYLQSDNPDEQLKGAEALFKLQKYEEAAPVFAKFMSDAELNRKFNITPRLASAFDTLHQQYASQGDYRKALDYFTKYMQVKPDADPTPYSKYLFMIKRSETDMNNADSRFALASFAEQLGLIPTAKEEYRNILALDPKSSSALTALRRFADSDVADAREFMNQGQYTLASNMAQGVARQYPMYPDLIGVANQIQAQAQVEAQKAAQSTKAEARALAERGDNYYAQALSYLSAYVSTETDPSKRIFSPRNEAAKYLGQAIFAWKTALQMDPTLGDATTYNLTFKIQDASNKYAAVANRRPPPIPRPYNNSSSKING